MRARAAAVTILFILAWGQAAFAQTTTRQQHPGGPARSTSRSTNWTGFYAGGFIGAGWASFTSSLTIDPFSVAGQGQFPASTFSIKPPTQHAVDVGGQAGYLMKYQQFLIGGEIDFGGFSPSHTDVVGTAATGELIPTDSLETSASWHMALLGRFGFTYREYLIYGTGGVSFAGVKAAATFPDVQDFAGLTASPSNTVTGGVFGAGASRHIGKNLSVAVEFLHFAYGTGSFKFGDLEVFEVNGAKTTSPAAATVKMSANTLRALVNIHLK